MKVVSLDLAVAPRRLPELALLLIGPAQNEKQGVGIATEDLHRKPLGQLVAASLEVELHLSKGHSSKGSEVLKSSNCRVPVQGVPESGGGLLLTDVKAADESKPERILSSTFVGGAAPAVAWELCAWSSCRCRRR